MTDAEIETLKELANELELESAGLGRAAARLSESGRMEFAKEQFNKTLKTQRQATAIRDLLALAEQARVMGVIDHVQSQQEPHSEYGDGWKDACDEIRMNIEAKAGEA